MSFQNPSINISYIKKPTNFKVLRRCLSLSSQEKCQKKLSFLLWNDDFMPKLTLANIFKTGYIFLLLSVSAPSSPIPPPPNLLNPQAWKMHTGKGSAVYTHANRTSAGALPQKLGEHGIPWCQFELFWEYKIISHPSSFCLNWK